MAKLGFYDIRTFETLNKEVELGTFNYRSIFDKIEDEEPEANNQTVDGNQRRN
jgi:hypothetical protein|tara:strand:- start:15 stop:173 length:159 start_codon:yes stop_codon:yes gene_type:complete